MSVLTRSVATFRRTGSSGMVWDDRFLFGDEDQMSNNEIGSDGRSDSFRELRLSRSTGFISNEMDRSQSNYNDQTTGLEPSLPKASKRAVTGIFKKSMSPNAAKPPKVSSR